MLLTNKREIDVTTQNTYDRSALLEALQYPKGIEIDTLKLLLRSLPPQNLQDALTEAMCRNNQLAVGILSQSALQQNERHPLNNYSIISLHGYDNKHVDKATTYMEAMSNSANILRGNGVKIDTFNFGKPFDEWNLSKDDLKKIPSGQQKFNEETLKYILDIKIRDSKENKIIMLDNYHGSVEIREGTHRMLITKDFRINTINYIVMCQEIAKEHKKEVVHVNISCYGGRALTKDLEKLDDEKKKNVNALSFSPTDASVNAFYCTGLLSSLICDAKFKPGNPQELLFKMFAQEFSEKTASHAKQRGIDNQMSLSSALVVNGNIIDSWKSLEDRCKNLEDKPVKIITEEEKKRAHELLQGTWPQDKIDKAFSDLQKLRFTEKEFEKLYQSTNKSGSSTYSTLKLLQIVAAALEFDKQCTPPVVTIYHNIVKSEEELKGLPLDKKKEYAIIIEDHFSASKLEELRSFNKSPTSEQDAQKHSIRNRSKSLPSKTSSLIGG